MRAMSPAKTPQSFLLRFLFLRSRARLLFKLAVETNMMMNVLASEVDVSPDALERLRGRCIQEVKKTGGAVTFTDAVKYQRGE